MINFPSDRSYTICQDITPYTGKNEVVDSITASTTPEEFDIILKKHPRYQFHYGDKGNTSALTKAAWKRNYPLVRHIATKMTPEKLNQLLKTGDLFGVTPLIASMLPCPEISEKENEKKTFDTVSTLLELKADVNLATNEKTPHSNPVPKHSTPLWVAANEQHVSVAKLLLKNGGNLHPQASQNGEKTLETAKTEIEVKKLILSDDGPLKELPQVITTLISNFYST